MSTGRWYAVFLCLLCNVIDGLDLLLASYALPHLPATFATAEEKGLLISLGFVGMAFGSIVLSPLADQVGRRNLIVLSLLVSTLAMAATAAAPWMELALAGRLVTGVAVGTVTPLSFVLADEYASESRRSFCVGIVALGFPVGSTLGGAIGLLAISSFGGAWQALYWFGALLSFVVFLIVYVSLPESLGYLVNRKPRDAERRVARIVARMRLGDVDLTKTPQTTEAESRTTRKAASCRPATGAGPC
ncbi:MFS transporter [Arthrobacter gyeryongensis]